MTPSSLLSEEMDTLPRSSLPSSSSSSSLSYVDAHGDSDDEDLEQERRAQEPSGQKGDGAERMGQVPSASTAAVLQLAVLQAQLEEASRPGSRASVYGTIAGGSTASARSSIDESWSPETIGRMRSASLRSRAESDRTLNSTSLKGKERAQNQDLVFPSAPSTARPRVRPVSHGHPTASTESKYEKAPIPESFWVRKGSLRTIPASPLPLERPAAPPDDPLISPTLQDALAPFFTHTPPTAGIPTSRSWPSVTSTAVYSHSDLATSAPNLGLALTVTSPVVPPIRRSSDKSVIYGAQDLKAQIGHAEKRYHTLFELVQTELAYVEALRVLVTIYFQSLHLLSSLSAADAAVITRNAVAVLELHERVAQRFARVEADLGWQTPTQVGSHQHDVRVRLAASCITSVIVEELPLLSIYEEFCMRHSEAIDIIRALETLPEWDLYERHCSRLLAARRVASPTATGLQLSLTPTPLSPSSNVSTKLRFQDYAIAPIQRLCRYPLILGQLLKTFGDAAEAMTIRMARDGTQKAAEDVEQAQRRREAELKTTVVAARMAFQSPVHMAFCDILGGSLLIGTLHVLHRAPKIDIPRIKYFGCFLYRTHLVIVKVRKRDSYEPREWLPLRLLEVHDVPEGEGLLAHSIRLSSQEHLFDLGASSSAEKAVWRKTILTTQTEARRLWADQPMDSEGAPTLFDDTQISSIPLADPSPAVTPKAPVPSSHSRSDSAPPSLTLSTVTTSASTSYFDDFVPRSPVDATIQSFSRAPLVSRGSRFSITASSLIGRTPASQRATIDVRLADVFSEELLSARASAARQNEALPARQRSQSGPRPNPMRRLSLMDRRQSSVFIEKDVDVIGQAFRGAVGFDADQSQLYLDPTKGASSKWTASLKRTTSSAFTGTKARPILPQIDVSLAESRKKDVGTWKTRTQSLRRAASHSSLDSLHRQLASSPVQMTEQTPAAVERNSSVSSGTSSSGTGDTHSSNQHYMSESPPTSLPPSPDFVEPNYGKGGISLPMGKRWSNALPSLKRRKSQTAPINDSTYQKRAQSSQTLAEFFGQTSSPQSSPSLTPQAISEPNSPSAFSILSLPSTDGQRPLIEPKTKRASRFFLQYKLSPMT